MQNKSYSFKKMEKRIENFFSIMFIDTLKTKRVNFSLIKIDFDSQGCPVRLIKESLQRKSQFKRSKARALRSYSAAHITIYFSARGRDETSGRTSEREREREKKREVSTLITR